MAKVSPFRPKEKKHEFGLHVKCCYRSPSMTIHEENLMQALAFFHVLNFLNIMHLLDMDMQDI